MTDQLALADEGELAPTETFKRTANRAKSIGIIRKAPWDSWKGSRVGRHIRFVEEFIIAPVIARPMIMHGYQREMFEAWLDPFLTEERAQALGEVGKCRSIAHGFPCEKDGRPRFREPAELTGGTPPGAATRPASTAAWPRRELGDAEKKNPSAAQT